VQVRRIEALREQPVAHADPVERQQLGARLDSAIGKAKARRPMPSRRCAEAFDEVGKAPILAALAGADAGLRQQAFLPAAVAIEPLLRRRAEVALVVDRLGVRVALQHAEFGKQFAHGDRLAGRQRQVVRAPGIGADGIAPGARIAASLASSSTSRKSPKPACASFQPAARPPTPAPTITTGTLRVSPGGSEVCSHAGDGRDRARSRAVRPAAAVAAALRQPASEAAPAAAPPRPGNRAGPSR
jgi:hypothetical protein